jgi:hypothetical protein
VNDASDTGLVDSHTKGHSGNNYLRFIVLKVGVRLYSIFGAASSMIETNLKSMFFNKIKGDSRFFSRGCINNNRTLFIC